MILPFTRRRLLADSRKLGRWGEKQSERFLKKKGFRFITRNFRCKPGEVDLIMSDATGALVFIEVKTRRSESKVKAQDSIDKGKRRRIAAAAKYFVRQYEVKDRPWRFDVMAVVLPKEGPVEIRHYRNAFIP